jgi:hypothetical protein
MVLLNLPRTKFVTLFKTSTELNLKKLSNLKLLAGCNEPTTEQIIGQLGLLASAPAKSGKNAFGSDWHIRLQRLSIHLCSRRTTCV